MHCTRPCVNTFLDNMVYIQHDTYLILGTVSSIIRVAGSKYPRSQRRELSPFISVLCSVSNSTERLGLTRSVSIIVQNTGSPGFTRFSSGTSPMTRHPVVEFVGHPILRHPNQVSKPAESPIANEIRDWFYPRPLQYLPVRYSPKPLYSQDSTQAPLVERLHPAILDLSSCPGLTTIEKNCQNSSSVYSDLGTGPDVTVVPDPTKHTECTVSLPYPDTKLLVDGTVRGQRRSEIGKTGNLLNRITLHRDADRIRL